MKIHSKKAFRFDKDGQASVTVASGFSPELPEWIRETKLFRLAVKEDSIRVIEKKSDQAEIEKSSEDSELAELKEKAKELGIKNYDKMKQPTLEVKIAEVMKRLEDEQKKPDEDDDESGGENNGDGGGSE